MTHTQRPETLQAMAERAEAGEDASLVFREFLDAWYAMPTYRRIKAVAGEPVRFDPVWDAWLGAAAELLALREGIAVPPWSEQPYRFLRRPFFAGGLESLKATLLVESPSPFRRRQIFVSANALKRA